ncbi:MAG TPA: phosphatase PAP2 family protein [Terracidiphilus sp.]|nr:phosphatase PAP2 family protein [Terracidiphilus sp.]
MNRVWKWFYGAVFVLLLPVCLVAWAKATAETVHLRLAPFALLGLPIAVIGLCLVLLGMLHLWTYGRGLPMNAFPPPVYVERGIYRLLPHPIYIGFTLVCAGVSIAAGSASGLWLVSPIVALGCASLVLGYERHDLVARFGRAPRALLPAAGPERPTASDRIACYFFVFIPWLALYEAVLALGLPPDGSAAQFAFELRLPVMEWTEPFYFSAYVVTTLAPLFARKRSDLRTFCLRALGAMAIAFPLYLILPFEAPPRAFTAHTVFGRLLQWERGLDSAACAFPSFHVIWAFLSAELYARRRPGPLWSWAWRAWAMLVAASCVLAGQHPIGDVAGGLAVVALVVRGAHLWRLLRNGSEYIANSWREWRVGSIRVINHGVYVGIGAFVALWLAVSFAGPGEQAPIFVAALLAVAGAALWAQYIEGSPQLLRPFGFYGGLLGGTLGAMLAPTLRSQCMGCAGRVLRRRSMGPGDGPAALPGARLLSWPACAGLDRDSLYAPALARAAHRRLGRFGASPNARLFALVESDCWDRDHPALDPARTSAFDRRALLHLERAGPICRGSVARRTSDAHLCRPATVSVGGCGQRSGWSADDCSWFEQPGSRTKFLLAHASGVRRFRLDCRLRHGRRHAGIEPAFLTSCLRAVPS